MRINDNIGGVIAPYFTDQRINAAANSSGVNTGQVQNVSVASKVTISNSVSIERCMCGIFPTSKHNGIETIKNLVGAMLMLDILMKFMDAFRQLEDMLSISGYNKNGQSESSDLYVLASKESKELIIGVPTGSNYGGFSGPQTLKLSGDTLTPFSIDPNT